MAKWIVFNRKHAAKAFVPVLKESLLSAKTAALQLTRLSVLHEVLVLYKKDASGHNDGGGDDGDDDAGTKWDRTEALRVTLGEAVIVPLAAQLEDLARDKVRTTFLKEWDDYNSFAGPTLIHQIRKAVTVAPSLSSKKTTTTTAEPMSLTTEAVPDSKKDDSSSTAAKETEASKVTETNKQPTKEKTGASEDKDKNKKAQDSTEMDVDDTAKDSPTKKTPKTSSTSASASAATYDFEASGIPAAKVDPKTLLEPTRTIASLQIARDLRNDGAVQLSSLLANLPENIKQSCQDKEELTSDKARDYAMRTPDVLLDMDLEDQLQSIRMYRDIVKRQRASRKQLIRALIQSRCQFGADEAADGFENAHRARDQLLKRKQVLMDAMELEGLDVTEEEKNLHATDAVEFPPLEWHKKPKTYG